jgi:APA family basic amino acid/polyamine antiporter
MVFHTIAAPKGTLLRVLGVGFGVAVSLGNSIGAGIMQTPAEIASRLPSASLIMFAWIVGAFYSLLGAWSLSEVAAMIPSAGGSYAIARRAFGDYMGFAVGWTSWASLCAANAAIALVVGEYLSNLLPRFSRHTVYVAAAVVVLVMLLQSLGIRWSSRFQNLTSAITALVFFSLVLGAFLLPRHVSAHSLGAPPISEGMHLFVAWVVVLQAVIFTFDGWNAAFFFGDEIINPGVELPRSMINGVLLLSAIYIFTNAALLYALGISGLAHQNLPIAAIGQMIVGARGPIIVRAFMSITLVSLIHATTLCASRILYAVNRDGWGSIRLAYVNRGGTPTMTLFLSACVTVGFVLSGSFDRVLAVTAFIFVSKYLLLYLSVFVLRRREPSAPRPYRAFGYPYTSAVAVLGSVAFLFGSIAADTRNSLYGCLVLIASYPVYRLARRNVVISPASAVGT